MAVLVFGKSRNGKRMPTFLEKKAVFGKEVLAVWTMAFIFRKGEIWCEKS